MPPAPLEPGHRTIAIQHTANSARHCRSTGEDLEVSREQGNGSVVGDQSPALQRWWWSDFEDGSSD